MARNTWQINPILYLLFTCATNDRLWHTKNGTRMPVQFLTDDERERLSQFPEQIQDEDITAFFTLSASDMKEIHKQRGEQN